MASNVNIEFRKLFINNEWVDSKSGKTFPVINPSTGESVADIQEADEADVNQAVQAAKKAFERKSTWTQMNASQRGELLIRLAHLIKDNVSIITELNTIDSGKPLTASIGEVLQGVSLLTYYAGLADKINGQTLLSDGPVFSYTRREPIGVCGLIVPWNFPISILCMKIGPALAAGCTLVIKPAEQTPLASLFIASLFKKAEFPAGVVNMVPGYGPTAGAAISNHMDIAKVSFTGSTEVGKLILKASADSNLKKVSLELGGKSPNIIFADADLDYAVEMAHQSIMYHSGQICCAGSRTYVHEDIYEEFVKRSVERAKKRVVGDGFDKKSESGPQVDEDSLKKILDLIESGKKEGAKLHCGGKRMDRSGYFVEPTVFSDVNENMRIGREEIFGPVQSIFKFKTIDEVIEKANNTHYGLAACVFTKDLETSLTVAHAIKAGTIWVNCVNYFSPQQPFGGYKQSGIGRELLVYNKILRLSLLYSLQIKTCKIILYCLTYSMKFCVYEMI
ncbi:DgyrCDS13765 [Dimorphilus gyrociliatus]|uniref:DgyrCDS13765 n=1 Tax=Dimorphilus gyrociliatus TaxID=2664684 RepID=A0A7I8WBP3_9ANNE|nr:DgyrCDS13765 [Dimorphilus gyrociliatus]